MRKMLIFVVMTSPLLMFSQSTFGVKGGVNFTSVNPLPITLGSINTHFGAFYSIKSNEKWTLQPEILISYNRFFSEDFGSISLSYLTIPLVAKYYIFPKLNVQLGVQYGVLMNTDGNNRDYLPFDEIINPTDFNPILGIGCDFLKHLHIEGRALPEISRMIVSDQTSTYRKINFQVSLSIPLSSSKLKEAFDVRDWKEPIEN